MPLLADSPWSFELEAKEIRDLKDGGALLVCKIHNTLVDERLRDESLTLEQRLRACAPVRYVADCYFSGNDGRFLGSASEA